MKLQRFCWSVGLAILLASGNVSDAFAQNDVTSRASLEEDIRGMNESLKRMADRLDILENNYAALQKQLQQLQTDLRAQPPTTSVSPQEIERLSVAIKELETARERDKAALIDQVAKLLDEFKRRELGGGAGKTDSDQFLKHTVQRGEYLSTIAKRYGVTVAEIQKTNKLSSDLVKVGQVLLIPKKD